MASSSTGGSGESFDGVIHGKFESGYIITLTMGSEELKGVLYETSQNPVLTSSINSNGSVSSSVQRRRRRKKSEIKKRDPALPKPTRSGYNFFFAKKHAEVKQQYHEKHYREISKLVGELWNKLQESDKMVYREMAMKDKERYNAEMEAYRQSQLQVVLYDVPVRQVPPQPHCNSDMFNDVHMTINEAEPDFPHTAEVNNYDGRDYEQDFNVTADTRIDHKDAVDVTEEVLLEVTYVGPENKSSKGGLIASTKFM